MRQPAGLDAAGKRLWKSMVNAFDLDDEPHNAVGGQVQRALLAQLLGRLGLPDNDEDETDPRTLRRNAARKAAKARWDRGY